MPSPVLIAPLVVNGNMRPAPPPAMITVRASKRRIWPLPARRINGIGPKSGAKLEALGVRTIAELAAADQAWLVEHFGRAHGAFMHDAAHGRDDRDVVTVSERSSRASSLACARA